MEKGDSAAVAAVMLTSGASGRVNALFSMRVVNSLLILINAIVMLFLLPFRGRKRSVSTAALLQDDKQDQRKLPPVLLRVPPNVPWKSSSVVDQDVAARRALAIRRVMQANHENSLREFSLFVTSRGETMFTQSWILVSKQIRYFDHGASMKLPWSYFQLVDQSASFWFHCFVMKLLVDDLMAEIIILDGIGGLVVVLHGLNEHGYGEFAKELNANGFKVYAMDWTVILAKKKPKPNLPNTPMLFSEAEILDLSRATSMKFQAHFSSFSNIASTLSMHPFGMSVHQFGCHWCEKVNCEAPVINKSFIGKVVAENPGLPCFCFGHSTGGAIILKAVLDPNIEACIAGVVLTSPAVGVQPSHPIFTVLAPVFSWLFPRLQLRAANKQGMVVCRDPEALVAKYSDPLVYTGSIRIRTGYEILRITTYLQQNLRRLKVPFLVLHGTTDTITDPEASKKLYEEASSTDKTIKLLQGCLHDLLFEPEREMIVETIIDWLNCRVY
ncbi:unnamed protein product [Camellia sinensis]